MSDANDASSASRVSSPVATVPPLPPSPPPPEAARRERGSLSPSTTARTMKHTVNATADITGLRESC
jgi:hypothetical protein